MATLTPSDDSNTKHWLIKELPQEIDLSQATTLDNDKIIILGYFGSGTVLIAQFQDPNNPDNSPIQWTIDKSIGFLPKGHSTAFYKHPQLNKLSLFSSGRINSIREGNKLFSNTLTWIDDAKSIEITGNLSDYLPIDIQTGIVFTVLECFFDGGSAFF